MSAILVGAGGHAKVLAEVLAARGIELAGYVDPEVCDWLPGLRRIESDQSLARNESGDFVIGFGGVTPDQLRRRLDLFRRYRSQGRQFPAIVHPAAWVSRTATIDSGAVILGGAIVQPGAVIGEAAIVNSGAIVEHDVQVGAGSHVAPGAVILGDAKIGECVMVGARAVVVQGAHLSDGGFVRSLERFPR